MASSRNLPVAPEGYLWMCGACGRVSSDGSGWDESCRGHAVLVVASSVQRQGRGWKATAAPEKERQLRA